MKYLKLLGILLLVVGAVAGVMYLSNGEGGKKRTSSQGGAYARIADEIRVEWGQTKNWNPSLFERHRSTIVQSYKAKRLSSPSDTVRLIDYLCSEALGSVVSALEKSYSSPLCKKSSVDADYEGIKILSKYIGDDPRIKEQKQVYGTYNEIRNFALSSHSFKPGFTPEGNSSGKYWTPYPDRVKSEVGRGNTYRANAIYKSKLSKISELKDGLDRVEKTMDNNRWNYYNTLYRDIVDHFKDMEGDDLSVRNKELYATMYQDFYAEVKPYESDKNIASLRANLLKAKNAFGDLVDELMKRREADRLPLDD